MRVLLLPLGAGRTWWHVLWMLGLILLVLALRVVTSPPVLPTPTGVYVTPPELKPAVDPNFLTIMATARQESIELGQRRLTVLSNILARRVEINFLPRYLSFSRRKLEELNAYNTFAWNQIQSLFGDKRLDAATPILVANFEEDFASLVLTPLETKEILRSIGREVARKYSTLVADGLQKFQERQGIPFASWQRYLTNIPPGRITIDGHTALHVPIVSLTVPDPMRDRLGEAIGASLEARFANFPKITQDIDALRLPDGRSIFDIGSDVWTYYGGYVVYWLALVILLRSGIVPVNLFAFLLGWLAWETFVWGSWIAFESFNFEQTKAQLEPIILHQTDTYFTALRSALTDPSNVGPFQILWQVEQAWNGTMNALPHIN